MTIYPMYNKEETEPMQYRYKLQADKPDERDFVYAPEQATPSTSGVDLRPQLANIPIFDQGQLGSCTANAMVAATEHLLSVANTQADGYYFNLSRLFLYWKERELENTINEDSGAIIRDGLKVLNQTGVCRESFFPYDASAFANTPSQDANSDAPNYKIATYTRVNGVEDMKTCLSEGYPVIFGMEVYSGLESPEAAQTGMVPMPSPNENSLGGHCVLAVGYNDTHVIVRNSWGENWGDKGHFYLPFDYLINYVWDMWTIR